MSELEKIDNTKILQELKYRVEKKKINPEEIFSILETSQKPELITEYEVADLSKLTKEDWKKAYQALEKDKVYQKEVKLWDSINDEDGED